MSWITENIISFITDFIGGTIDWFGDMLNNIFVWIVEQALTDVYVTNAENFIIISAIALVGLVVVKTVTSGYLLETDYDSEEDPFNLIIKIAQTVAVILNSGWIFDWMLATAKDYSADLLGTTDTSGYCEITNSLLQVLLQNNIFDLGRQYTSYVIMLGAILISFVIFSVVAGLRGAELIAMKLFFPYFALDLLTNSRERWKNFSMAYAIAFFSYAFQILFFVVALKSYASVSILNADYAIVTMVWMIMAIRAPKFIEKFIYKSGVSDAASSGIRMMAQTVLMRGAFK